MKKTTKKAATKSPTNKPKKNIAATAKKPNAPKKQNNAQKVVGKSPVKQNASVQNKQNKALTAKKPVSTKSTPKKESASKAPAKYKALGYYGSNQTFSSLREAAAFAAEVEKRTGTIVGIAEIKGKEGKQYFFAGKTPKGWRDVQNGEQIPYKAPAGYKWITNGNANPRNNQKLLVKIDAKKSTQGQSAQKKTAQKPSTATKTKRAPRFFAEEIQGKGYVFDREFSEKLPIAVEKSADVAAAQCEKFNEAEKLEQYCVKHNLDIRRVTSKDLRSATTDYQHQAKFVIKLPNGKEYFSANGSLADCKAVVAMQKE